MEEANSGPSSPISYLISLYSAVCGYFRRLFLRILAVGPVPKHIAIIMDGNRRYADRSHMDRTRGHLYGYDRLISTLESCWQLGVKYVTVYAFSIDNFRRPADEVHALMNLMEEKLDHLCNSNRLTKEFDVRVQVLGDLSLLPSNVRAAAERAMLATRQNRSVVLNICMAYTSTAEIVHSIQEIRDKFLVSIKQTVPVSTETSTYTCSTEFEVGNWNGINKQKHEGMNGFRNGYHYRSGLDAANCTSEQLEASNDYSALQRMSRSRKNGFVRDGAVDLNLTLVERDGKRGQEPRNSMTEDPVADEKFHVKELTEESDNGGNAEVCIPMGFLIKRAIIGLFTS